MQGLTNVSKQQRGELPNRREGTEMRAGTLVKMLILCRDEMRDGSENLAAEGVSVDTVSAKTKAAPGWGAASQVFLFRFHSTGGHARRFVCVSESTDPATTAVATIVAADVAEATVVLFAFHGINAVAVGLRNDRSLICILVTEVRQNSDDNVTPDLVQLRIGIVQTPLHQHRKRCRRHPRGDLSDMITTVRCQFRRIVDELISVHHEISRFAVRLLHVPVSTSDGSQRKDVRHRHPRCVRTQTTRPDHARESRAAASRAIRLTGVARGLARVGRAAVRRRHAARCEHAAQSSHGELRVK